MARRNVWTDEMVEFLYSLWGQYTATAVANQINARYGSKVTPMACCQKAARHGILGQYNQGGVTLMDVARELGVNRMALSRHLTKQGIKTSGRGKYRFVSLDVFDSLKAAYAAPPEPVVTSGKAAKALGYHPNYFRNLVTAGKIRGYKHLGRLWVASAEITRIKLERLRAAA